MKTHLINSINPLYLVALVPAALILLVACGSDDREDPDASPAGSDESTRTVAGSPHGSRAGSSRLQVECTVGGGQSGLLADLEFGGDNGLFEEGEDIEMKLTLINCGDSEVQLFFPTAQRYEVSIEDANGIQVWNSSDGKAFSQATAKEVIATGETVVYTETWEQEDAQGEQVPLGTYRVSALSVGCGQEDAINCTFGSVKLLEIVD